MLVSAAVNGMVQFYNNILLDHKTMVWHKMQS